MADDSLEAAKKRLAEDKKAADKSRADYGERTRGKPTPTQEENDLHALGATFTEHEDDGSGPDPHLSRHLEAEKPAGGYQTRQSTAKPASTHAAPHQRGE